jgi:hypothetical protein
MSRPNQLVLYGLAAVVAVSGIFGGCRKHEDSGPTEWINYKGQSQGYKCLVEITSQNGKRTRAVHLEEGTRSDLPYELTGWDRGADGSFESIFFRKTSLNGYNELTLESSTDYSKSKWKPCNADKNEPRPSAEEIKTALQVLETARQEIEKPENQEDLLKGSEERK